MAWEVDCRGTALRTKAKTNRFLRAAAGGVTRAVPMRAGCHETPRGCTWYPPRLGCGDSGELELAGALVQGERMKRLGPRYMH